jgi:hypothetical protein
MLYPKGVIVVTHNIKLYLLGRNLNMDANLYNYMKELLDIKIKYGKLVSSIREELTGTEEDLKKPELLYDVSHTEGWRDSMGYLIRKHNL